MDKSISSNVRHVFMILVSYYCDVTNKVLVEHLEYSCTSDNLFFMKALFKKRFLPRKNLLAVLSDSASTIRGTVTGLETKLRGNLAQQLLEMLSPAIICATLDIHIIFLLSFRELVRRYFQQVYVICWVSRFDKRNSFPSRDSI